MKIISAILFFCFILFLYFKGNKDDKNLKMTEAEAYTQPEVVKDSSTTDWWELGSTDLGHWVQETLNLSGTEANVTLWITFTLLLITFLSYILDLKALRGKIKINVSLGITLFFIIGVVVYGIAFKGETVQNWLNSASSTSWFNSIDTKQRLTFKRAGESEEVTMGIGSQLTVNLPASIPNSGMVYKVCFQLIGPPVLAKSKELPDKVLKNMNGERSSNTHNFIINEDLGALMGRNAIGYVTIKASIIMGNPGNIPCPSN